MRIKQGLWSDVTLLIVAVLAIMAFIRGGLQIVLLIGVFVLWTIRAVYRYGLPYLRMQMHRYEARRIHRKYKAVSKKKTKKPIGGSDPVGLVLLRHVNFRISAYLQSSYPEATWEWCEEYPERIIARGGTGRIRLHGVPDFNFAEVSFQQNAEINCSLLKVVPLELPVQTAEETEKRTKKPNPIDPQVWYETKAREVLRNLITDLNSRGHHSLTILENGDVSIQQADQEITRPVFDSMPDRMYWSRLSKVFEREGMAANINDKGLVVNW